MLITNIFNGASWLQETQLNYIVFKAHGGATRSDLMTRVLPGSLHMLMSTALSLGFDTDPTVQDPLTAFLETALMSQQSEPKIRLQR